MTSSGFFQKSVGQLQVELSQFEQLTMCQIRAGILKLNYNEVFSLKTTEVIFGLFNYFSELFQFFKATLSAIIFSIELVVK